MQDAELTVNTAEEAVKVITPRQIITEQTKMLIENSSFL